MAICSSRTELKNGSVMGSQTGTISLIDVGAGAVESNLEVPFGNDGSLIIGRSLDAAADRGAAREHPYAANARAVVGAEVP